MQRKKHYTRTGSPPLPLAHEVTAAHVGRFRRSPAPRSTPSRSPRSAPPFPPARFSAPGLYCKLATPPSWLGFQVGLRRRVSGGPWFLLLPSWTGSATPTPHLLFISSAADVDGPRHGSSHPPRSPPSRASSRRCEGRHGPAAPQGFILCPSHPILFPILAHLVSFPSHAG